MASTKKDQEMSLFRSVSFVHNNITRDGHRFCEQTKFFENDVVFQNKNRTMDELLVSYREEKSFFSKRTKKKRYKLFKRT